MSAYLKFRWQSDTHLELNVSCNQTSRDICTAMEETALKILDYMSLIKKDNEKNIEYRAE